MRRSKTGERLKAEFRRAQRKRAMARYYKLNSILGHQVPFYVIVGGRKTGKSYSVAEFLCNHRDDMNYWMRISDTSVKAMLADKCRGMIDPDLVRKYNLDLKAKGGMYVENHGEPFITACPLSAFGKLKGVGFYDKDYDGWYNIALDEFQLEQGEKRTSFDILYNFIGMCENTVRTTKGKVRVFLLGNTLEEASTILKAFNFLPQKFGRFCLHRYNKYTHKREKFCVIDNLEPTEEYLKDRYGSIADLLGGDKMSNYTNELMRDTELIYKGRRHKPLAIIKFSKQKDNWYTVWDKNIVCKYNGEQLPANTDFAMKPYINTFYSRERRQVVLDMYDARAYLFNSLITQSYFTEELAKLRKT